LQGVSVNGAGEISGFFSNGQNRNLGQVALADFQSPWGLLSLGEGLYASAIASGEAAYGAAGSGGRGDVSSGTLELSNVDLAKEFVKMITAQRGFQANSRVITTSDELLTDVVNLKR
jgi:flagellar hook protein FlgE